jgi:hypothetical protein
MRICRIRLSEKGSRCCPREIARPLGKADEAQHFMHRGLRKPLGPRPRHFVLDTQPLTQPFAGVLFHRPIGLADTLRPARSPSRLATLYTRGFSSLVASTAALIVTGWSEPVPGRVTPAMDHHLSRRTRLPRYTFTERGFRLFTHPVESRIRTHLGIAAHGVGQMLRAIRLFSPLILMKPQRVYWLGFVLFLASGGLAQSQQDARDVPNKFSEGEVFSHGGTLIVWVPNNYVRGRMDDPTARVINAYPWGILQSEFKRDFPNFDLDFKILDRDEFVSAFHASQPDRSYPDVAFVDNYSELRPLMNNNAVMKMWGQPRLESDGWWVIFRQAKNFEASEAFMLWLSQSPQWKPMRVSTVSISPADIAVVQAISKEAVQDFVDMDAHSLLSIMDPAASHFDDFGDRIQTIQNIEPLLTFGNSRLAFVLLAEVGQGEKAFGMTHSAVILRKLGNSWKVLLFLPNSSLPTIEGLLGNFDHLGLDEGPRDAAPNVTLLAPADHARLMRYPPSDIEWSPVDPNLATYVIESQFCQLRREYWSQSAIKVVSPIPYESSIRMEMPFGVGKQPHRWRVWAIDKSGIVSTSDWRVIDFTN